MATLTTSPIIGPAQRARSDLLQADWINGSGACARGAQVSLVLQAAAVSVHLCAVGGAAGCAALQWPDSGCERQLGAPQPVRRVALCGRQAIVRCVRV